MKDRRQTVIEKIEARCDIVDTGFKVNNKASPCHLWTGPTSGSGRGGGYGRMCLDGQTVAVHIVAYTHYFGYVPSKKQVDHLCNQRLCCNPQHLELVTHLQNQRRRDKRAKETIKCSTNSSKPRGSSKARSSSSTSSATGISHSGPSTIDQEAMVVAIRQAEDRT